MRSPTLTVPAALARELGQELVREAVAREGEVLELLHVGQTTGAVVLEHELILIHHLAARGRLGVGERVADDLEDDVERGQREDDHHHALVAAGDLELVGGSFDVAHQVAVQFGLAVLVEADGVVELGGGLARHDRLEERDQVVRPIDLDVEVGAGEAEHDADFIRGHQRGIDEDAAAPLWSARTRGIAWSPLPIRPTIYAPLFR